MLEMKGLSRIGSDQQRFTTKEETLKRVSRTTSYGTLA